MFCTCPYFSSLVTRYMMETKKSHISDHRIPAVEYNLWKIMLFSSVVCLLSGEN